MRDIPSFQLQPPRTLHPLLAQLSRSQILPRTPSSHSSQQGGQCPLSLGLPLLPTLTLAHHILAQTTIPVGRREGSFPIQLQKGSECHALPQGFPWAARLSQDFKTTLFPWCRPNKGVEALKRLPRPLQPLPPSPSSSLGLTYHHSPPRYHCIPQKTIQSLPTMC